MKNFVSIVLLGSVLMVLQVAAQSQDIEANRGEKITVKAGGKIDDATVTDIEKIIIEDVTIDYSPWKKANFNLKLDRQDAARKYERERGSYFAASEEVRNALSAFTDAMRRVNENRYALWAAEQDANMDEDMKSREYKRVEARIARIKQRQEEIDERIDQRRRLENGLARLAERLNTLRQALGAVNLTE